MENEKKQIKLDVKYRLERGELKQQILEDLSHLYKDKVTLMRQIEINPSKTAKEKYGIYNYLLSFLLLALLILDMVLLFRVEKSEPLSLYRIVILNTLVCIILDAVFFAGVWTFHIELYNWIATRALVSLLTLIISMGHFHTLAYISLFLTVVAFALGLWLCVKLCPPRIPKIIEVNVDGIEKINKTIYVYPD